jgi:hypothetical protein
MVNLRYTIQALPPESHLRLLHQSDTCVSPPHMYGSSSCESPKYTSPAESAVFMLSTPPSSIGVTRYTVMFCQPSRAARAAEGANASTSSRAWASSAMAGADEVSPREHRIDSPRSCCCLAQHACSKNPDPPQKTYMIIGIAYVYISRGHCQPQPRQPAIIAALLHSVPASSSASSGIATCLAPRAALEHQRRQPSSLLVVAAARAFAPPQRRWQQGGARDTLQNGPAPDPRRKSVSQCEWKTSATKQM